MKITDCTFPKLKYNETIPPTEADGEPTTVERERRMTTQEQIAHRLAHYQSQLPALNEANENKIDNLQVDTNEKGGVIGFKGTIGGIEFKWNIQGVLITKLSLTK